jgi:hypothetical protein
MTNKEFQLKRKKLREELKGAKDLEQLAYKKHAACEKTMENASANLDYWRLNRIKIETQLNALEWKHGKDSPECTGAEY